MIIKEVSKHKLTLHSISKTNQKENSNQDENSELLKKVQEKSNNLMKLYTDKNFNADQLVNHFFN